MNNSGAVSPATRAMPRMDEVRIPGSAYGSTFYETPAIDRLAREGAQFRCAYGASPVCSPSRAAVTARSGGG